MKARKNSVALKEAHARRQSLKAVWYMIVTVLLFSGGYIILEYSAPQKSSPHAEFVQGFTGPKGWIGKEYLQQLKFKAPDYYKDILRTKAPHDVNANYKAVHLLTYLDGELQWLGTGTRFIQKSDGIEYVLTAGHLFDIDVVGTNIFIFMDINDPEGKFYGIDHIFKSNELKRSGTMPLPDAREVDVAVCRKGPITLLSGYSHLFKTAGRPEDNKFSESDRPWLVLTSLVSGISYPMLGVGYRLGLSRQQSIPFLVFDYQSKPGESGTGFVGNDGAVYVLMGSMEGFDFSQTGLKRRPRIGATRAMMLNFNQ